MQLQYAKTIAVNIGYMLKPHCSKLNIAGSVRRGKPEVKDIEIVCIPAMMTSVNKDLFGGSSRFFYMSPDFVEIVQSLGTVIKGKPDGRYMQIALPEGINLDLFMPEANDYYRQYAIRTGPADYAHKIIAAGWLRNGWCGSDKGLRKQKDCIKDSSGAWKCIKTDAELPPVWESEEVFFEWLQLEWIHPSKR